MKVSGASVDEGEALIAHIFTYLDTFLLTKVYSILGRDSYLLSWCCPTKVGLCIEH